MNLKIFCFSWCRTADLGCHGPPSSGSRQNPLSTHSDRCYQTVMCTEFSGELFKMHIPQVQARGLGICISETHQVCSTQAGAILVELHRDHPCLPYPTPHSLHPVTLPLPDGGCGLPPPLPQYTPRIVTKR